MPASVVFLAKDTRGGRGVQAVYTQKGYRGKGYANKPIGEVCRWTFQVERRKYLTVIFEGRTSAARIFCKVGFGEGDDTTDVYVNVNVMNVEMPQRSRAG